MPAENEAILPDRPAVPLETAIYQLGIVIGHAFSLRHSLLFLAATEGDEQRLRDLITAAQTAARALGVTLWDEDENAG